MFACIAQDQLPTVWVNSKICCKFSLAMMVFQPVRAAIFWFSLLPFFDAAHSVNSSVSMWRRVPQSSFFSASRGQLSTAPIHHWGRSVSTVITLVFHPTQTKNAEAISSISVCPSHPVFHFHHLTYPTHPAPPKLAWWYLVSLCSQFWTSDGVILSLVVCIWGARGAGSGALIYERLPCCTYAPDKI